jgi:hypothetical protein
MFGSSGVIFDEYGGGFFAVVGVVLLRTAEREFLSCSRALDKFSLL